jgi:hypothetical protein
MENASWPAADGNAEIVIAALLVISREILSNRAKN